MPASMAPITSRSSRNITANKENIPCHVNSKAGVAIRSPAPKKKKRGLKILGTKPSLILASANNETISCGVTEKKMLQNRVEKKSVFQGFASNMIYKENREKPPKANVTKAKALTLKTTGKSPPNAKPPKTKQSRPSPTKRATPVKKTYFGFLSKGKSKVKGHGNVSSAIKPKLPVINSASESASDDNPKDHNLSLEGIPQATHLGPAVQTAKEDKHTKSPTSTDKNPSSLGSESAQQQSLNQVSTFPGVPQGSNQGPLRDGDSSYLSVDRSACFELNVLLQGLKEVKWSPVKPIMDVDARGDIMTMKDYAKDFYAYLQTIEQKCVCPADYLCSSEPGMPTSSMRSVLLDWLMQVQAHLNLKDETLHLSARLIDKFQSRHPIDLDRFQLVGVGCLLLAAKYEERFAPEVALLVYLTDNSYTREDIVSMEGLVWKTLQFDLCWPTTITFLRRVLQVVAINKEITCSFSALKTLASYLIDLALLSNSMASFYPSETAAAALRLALYVLCPDVPDVWDTTLTHYSNYTERQLTACISSFAELVTKGARSRCQAPAKKHGKTYESAKLIKYLPESPIIMEFLNNESAV